MKSKVVCIRDREGRTVCGTPVHSRENPSAATTLAAMRYRRQPEVLHHLRAEAPEDQTIDEALVFLEGDTGERQEREASLHLLSEYIRGNFTSAAVALEWLTKRDLRLGAWCAAQTARAALPLLAYQEQRERPERAIMSAENWVRGQGTASEAENAAKGAAAAAYALKSSPEMAYAAYAARAAAYTAAYASDALSISKLSALRTTDQVRGMAVASARATAEYVNTATDYQIAQALVGVVADAVLTFPQVIR